MYIYIYILITTSSSSDYRHHHRHHRSSSSSTATTVTNNHHHHHTFFFLNQKLTLQDHDGSHVGCSGTAFLCQSAWRILQALPSSKLQMWMSLTLMTLVAGVASFGGNLASCRLNKRAAPKAPVCSPRRGR